MSEESRNDHESEEDVEGEGSRKLRDSEVQILMRSLVIDDHGARHCINGVNREFCCGVVQNSNTNCGEEHQAWKYHDPAVHGIDNIEAI
jgi:hypothetical protein